MQAPLLWVPTKFQKRFLASLRSDKGRLKRPIVTRPGRFSVNLLGLSRVIREDFLRRINRDAV